MAGDRKLTIKFLGDAAGLRNSAGEVDSSLGRIRASVSEADGVMGKLKAGSSAAFGALKAHAAEAAMAAGTALVAFAASSVKAFQDTALEAGQTADALGVTSEEASRLAEVAGDLNIEMGTVTSSIQRMLKAAADGSIEVEGFGDTVARAADGTVDAYQTFINTATAIGAIEDSARRTQAAQETFGRSYAEIAQLMEMSATDLKAALDGVSDAKVIDEQELANAEALRDGIDRLKGVYENLQLAVGGAIAENAEFVDDLAANLEMIARYADELALVGRTAAAIVSPFQLARETWGLATDEIAFASSTLEEMNAWLDKNNVTGEERAQILAQWTAAQASANTATNEGTAAVAGYNAAISTNAALEVTAAENRRRTADETKYTAMAVDELRRKLGSYSEGLNAIPKDVYSEISALLDAGDIARAEALLNEVTRNRIVNVGIAINSGAIAGAAAGAAGPIGQTVGKGIAAALAGTKLPSSLTGGGGGGGGGGSPAAAEEDPMLAYDRAMANLYQTEQATLANYRQYLQGRIGAYATYSDEYKTIWSKLRELDKVEIDAAKEAADAEKRKQDEAKKAMDEQTKLAESQLEALRKLLDILTGFASADAGNLAQPGNIVGSGATGSLNAGQLGGLIADLLRFYQDGVA